MTTPTHAYPQMVADPRAFCTRCGVHRANEDGAAIPTLCPTCADDDRRRR